MVEISKSGSFGKSRKALRLCVFARNISRKGAKTQRNLFIVDKQLSNQINYLRQDAR